MIICPWIKPAVHQVEKGPGTDTPVPSPEWDNYNSSPEFTHKIPIVSTQYSDFDSLSCRIQGLGENSEQGSVQQSDRDSLGSVFEKPIAGKMEGMKQEQVELEALMQEIDYEIQ